MRWRKAQPATVDEAKPPVVKVTIAIPNYNVTIEAAGSLVEVIESALIAIRAGRDVATEQPERTGLHL